MPPVVRLEQERTSVIGLYPSMESAKWLRSLPERQQPSNGIDTCSSALDAKTISNPVPQPSNGIGTCPPQDAISNFLLAHLNVAAMMNALVAAQLGGGAAAGSTSATSLHGPSTRHDRPAELRALPNEDLGKLLACYRRQLMGGHTRKADLTLARVGRLFATRASAPPSASP